MHLTESLRHEKQLCGLVKEIVEGNVKDSPALKLHKAALESGNPASSIQTCTYTFTLPLSVSLSHAHTDTCTPIYPISFIQPHTQHDSILQVPVRTEERD